MLTKIKRSQGASERGSSAILIAPKPKGMWHRTYQYKTFEVQWSENNANRVLIAKLSHLFARLDNAYLRHSPSKHSRLPL
jgi:hypothetical protein